MKVNTSKLKQNIHHLLDRVLKTDVPLLSVRKGETLRIVPAEPVSKLARLKKRKVLLGSPEDIIHMDWSKEWRG